MKKFKVIGLISGTSADGIDAALVEIWEKEGEIEFRPVAFETFPYLPEVRKEVIQASRPQSSRVDKISQLNFLLGELFADAALKVIKKASLPINEIDLIGSHGQTIHHLATPSSFAGFQIASTLQLGEASIIAQRTGVTTVADFRPRDMAAYGCGAPLIPYFHYVAFKDHELSRLVLNIGGIANLTFIPAGSRLDDLIAFDAGPGNCLMDQLISETTQGEQSYDLGGERAQTGEVYEKLLSRLMQHTFVRRIPPKSTGPEEFNLKSLKLWPTLKAKMSPEDLLATLAAFTAHAIAYNIRNFIFPKGKVDQLIVGGGGVRNKVLFASLKVLLAPVHTYTFEDLGLSSDAAEAQGFALLAYLTFKGKGGNLPGVTGARERVLLGKIVPGRTPAVAMELVKDKIPS